MIFLLATKWRKDERNEKKGEYVHIGKSYSDVPNDDNPTFLLLLHQFRLKKNMGFHPKYDIFI